MKTLQKTLLAALVASPLTLASAFASPGVECRVELDRTVLPANGPQTAIVKVTLDAIRPPKPTDRPAVNLTLVMDRSGSMSGSKIQKAKQAAIEAVRRLGGQDLFSLVIYDHEVETVVPAQSASYVEWIEGRIQGITSRGNTALFSGVSQGAAEIRKNLDGQYVHRIILLSDGLANVGPSSPADLARLGTALLKEGISVTTIGVGTDFNEDLMTQLAGASDGNHYFVESSRDLPRIFAQELGDVLSVVAKQVLVRFECEEGVRPLRIIGRSGQIKGNRVEVQMNQLYGGQEKYALVEVEIAAGKAGERVSIATASCDYENVITQQKEKSSGKVDARFSRNEEEVTQSVVPAVQKAYQDNEVAETRDEALDLYNQGRQQEAAQLMRDKSSVLFTRNIRLRQPQMNEPLGDLSGEAEKLEMHSFDSADKKALRAGSYKVKSQQADY